MSLRETADKLAETQVWDEADPPSWVGPTTASTVVWMRERRRQIATYRLLPDMAEALEGLMEVAETAMPDSYFESDSRTTAAREALERYHEIEADERS